MEYLGILVLSQVAPLLLGWMNNSISYGFWRGYKDGWLFNLLVLMIMLGAVLIETGLNS